MKKILSYCTILALALSIASCGGGKAKANYSSLSEGVIKKVEKKVSLSIEQKEQIAKLTEASGLTLENEKSEEAKALFKKLMAQVRAEVLTADQQRAFNKAK